MRFSTWHRNGGNRLVCANCGKPAPRVLVGDGKAAHEETMLSPFCPDCGAMLYEEISLGAEDIKYYNGERVWCQREGAFGIIHATRTKAEVVLDDGRHITPLYCCIRKS